MKYIFVLFFVVISIISLATPVRAASLVECKSERNGYCVKLSSPQTPHTQQQHAYASVLFAATDPCAGTPPPFPGLEFLTTFGINFCSSIETTLSALYNFGVGIAGISALVMFMFGGMLYLTARESTSQTSRARTYMLNAVIGLLLVVTSYLILYTINPDLTFKLKLPDLFQKDKPISN